MSRTNYGGMVAVGIIAVLTAVVGASIWRAHELAVKRDLAIEAENQAAAARKGAEHIFNHLLDQLRDRLDLLDHHDIVEDAQRRCVLLQHFPLPHYLHNLAWPPK